MKAVFICIASLAVFSKSFAQQEQPLYSFMNVSLGSGYNFGKSSAKDWGLSGLLSDQKPGGVEIVHFNMEFFPVNKWRNWGWGISLGVQAAESASQREQGIRAYVEDRYGATHWTGTEHLDQATGETRFLTGPVYRYEAKRWHFHAAAMLGFTTYDYSDYRSTLKQRNGNRVYGLNYTFDGAESANFAISGSILLGYRVTPFFSINAQLAPMYYSTSIALKTSITDYFTGQITENDEKHTATVFSTAARLNLMISINKKKNSVKILERK